MKKKLGLYLILIVFLVSGCGSNKQDAVLQVPTPEVELPQTSEEKILPSEILSICLNGRPNSLYIYDPINLPAKRTLAVVYDGMLPASNKLWKASILERLPTYEAGDAKLVSVEVFQKDLVVTANQTIKELTPGDIVLPSGCRDANCAVMFTGEPILMDQVMVNFKFLPDLLWSDNQPLTIQDSLFSFELAKKSFSTEINELISRTLSFEQTSDDEVQWWGIPGYLAVEPGKVFFPPLPRHLMENISIDDLEKNAMSSELLVGWGAYKFDRWVDGDMVLLPNENYFDPFGNQPQFKQLILRYFDDSNEIYSEFLAGQCNIIDPSAGFEQFLPALLEQANNKQLYLDVINTPLIERLVFNTQPDQINSVYERNPLSDPLVRAGISSCINRYALVNDELKGYPVVADSFFFPVGFKDQRNWSRVEHSIINAKEYLERSGWRDVDNDSDTPRVSRGIDDIPDGTPLNLVYATTDSPFRIGIAEVISSMLSECGIGIELRIFTEENFFKPSPEGILSGGHFDIAGYAAGTYEVLPPCLIFTRQQIPSDGNGWLGLNFGRYINPDFSTACANSYYSFSDKLALERSIQSAHEILTYDSAAVPLFHHLELLVAESDLCIPDWNEFDPVGMSNLELIRRGGECKP